jgi:tetratricopeptide (TPR) repeat protein
MMKRALIPGAIVVCTLMVAIAGLRDARATAVAAVAPSLPMSAHGTSRAELTSAVGMLTARLAAEPDNGAAVVSLANALIRLQRVNNDGRAVISAEAHLRAFLTRQPANYDAQRMLAAVLLSQHRFAEAIAAANAAMAIDARDAWNYGAAGDGYMELGDYDRAFAAFERMGQLQPGPPAYARTAYALEIKGDLDGALDYMRRAADGTSPNDPESQAWHYVQLGDLSLQLGRRPQARLEYERADATFPGHPMAVVGLARIKALDGDLAGARLMLQAQLARTATPDLAITIGDLSAELGDATAAAQYYQMAEQIERSAWGNGVKQPQLLARLLADLPGRSAEAVALAEEAARSRRDIFTMETLAWAYFRNGQGDQAGKVLAQALRTGSRNARIHCHADQITSSRAPAAIHRCPEWRP